MAERNEFTHGGSVGKNILLLLRALVNVFAFFLLFYCLGTSAAWYYVLAAAAFAFICLALNLALPFIRRKK